MSLRFGSPTQEPCVDLGVPSKEETLTMGQLLEELSLLWDRHMSDGALWFTDRPNNMVWVFSKEVC